MNYSFGALGLSDLTWTGPDPFSSNATRNSDAISQGTVITVAGSAHWQALVLTDDEGHLHDGDAGQDSVGAQVFNGTTFASGTSVETEYSYVLRPVGSTDPADDITIYVLEFDGNVQAIAASARLVPGQSYTIIGGGSDDPSVLYQYLFICFAPGTQIATPAGAKVVRDLRAGDLVLTLDNGPQPLIWAGSRTVLAGGAQAPVRVAPGALGNGRALVLSPQHRVLVGRGGQEGLLPVKALAGRPGIARARPGLITWHHLLLEGHQVLFADGTPVESLFPGPEAARMLGPHLPEVVALLPGFGAGSALWTPARPLLRPGQWRRGLRHAA